MPNCSPNCPTTWLQDGICDKACNTSLCLFDGGDCLKKADKKRPLDHSSSDSSTIEKECATGCPTFWLADEHCDAKCNNLECGFDLGDCKTDQINTAFAGANYLSNQTEYKFNLSKSEKGIYLNMTDHFAKLSINKELNFVELNSTNEIQIKKLKFNQLRNLVFLLLNESSGSKLNFNLTLKLNSKRTAHIHLEINSDARINAPGRKLMDFYADSLSYSNYIINKKYRIQTRKVPAHMPMLLDKDILERMNIELYDEIEETSSHRFRNSIDLQFAFTYFYFLMFEQYYPTLEQIIGQYDSNLDQNLNRNEARTFYLSATKNQFEEKDFEQFWNESTSCLNSKRNDDQIPIRTLLNCNEFDFLSDEVKVRKRNKFVTLKMDDVSFNQISNDVDRFRSELDNLRKSPKQFICINDNFSYRDPNKIKFVNQILHDFYESLLPLKSSFENNANQFKQDANRIRSTPSNKLINKELLLLIFILFSASICLFSRFCYTQRKFKSINTV